MQHEDILRVGLIFCKSGNKLYLTFSHIYYIMYVNISKGQKQMTVSKSFISVYNEEKWLNKLGSKGYMLKGRKKGKYTFEKLERPVKYHIDDLDESPETPENTEYLQGKNVCGFKGNSAYIADEEHNSDTLKRQVSRFGKLTAFFGVVLALFLALFAYNLHYVQYFKSIGYVVPADKDEILEIFNFVVGKNPAVLFMWALAIIIAVLAVITAVYAREWLLWKNSLKALPSDTGIEDSEI